MKKSFLVIAIAAIMAACGGSAPLEKGTPVADQAAIETNEANSGQRFSIEGYLSSPMTIDANIGDMNNMGIYTEPAGEGTRLGRVPMGYGVSKNGFSVDGDNFEDEDIVYKDNEGAKHAYDVKAVYSFTATLEDGT
ncbi:MAG: hypothetical protein LBU95_06350 [Rikenellaceae bacterium]|jgi:predicted small lipoprotein YifL|nr:hypothetical protein [Rikenellaceae bacterium]